MVKPHFEEYPRPDVEGMDSTITGFRIQTVRQFKDRRQGYVIEPVVLLEQCEDDLPTADGPVFYGIYTLVNGRPEHIEDGDTLEEARMLLSAFARGALAAPVIKEMKTHKGE